LKIKQIRPSALMKISKKEYEKDLAFYRGESEKFQHRNCPGCLRINNGDFYLTHNGFTFSRCEACWTIYMNPGPTNAIVDRLYKSSNVYKYWSKEVYPKTTKQRREKLAEPRANFTKEALRSEHKEPRTVIEIGSGTGDVLETLKVSFPECKFAAIEPNPDMWKILMGKNIDLIQDNFINAKITEKVDAILAFEVVEHLLNPKEFFAFAKSHLVIGGLLIFSTPNAASIEVQFIKDNSNTVDIEHISLLTPSAIHSLASENGFEVRKIITPGEFDLELISKEHIALKIIFAMIPSLRKYLQNKISKFGYSSHMKVVLIRKS